MELALQICRDPLDAKEVLEDVGLGDRLNNFPAQLSGGEAAAGIHRAQALAKNPKLLLCDEPTGALDWQYRQGNPEAPAEYVAGSEGVTVIVIPHNQAIAHGGLI